MLDKISKFFDRLNKFGIPLPMLRDPKSGYASVSLTLTVISFNVVLVGLVGKWSQHLGGIDLTQSLYWFGICGSLYFGRTIIKKDKKMEIKTTNSEKENNDSN